MREPPTVPFTEKTSKSLLLVEDDPLLRESLFEYFERRGWHLTAVGTADEALGLVRRGALYDVVLTDIVMPGRLNGIDLTRCILQARPSTPKCKSDRDVGIYSQSRGIEGGCFKKREVLEEAVSVERTGCGH